MDTNETVEPVSDTAAIRGVFPRHPVKRLARLLSVPLGTAHEWMYRRLSNSRRREVARALLAEMDRQDVERSALRYRLAQWAAEVDGGNESEVAVPMGGLSDRETRAKKAKTLK